MVSRHILTSIAVAQAAIWGFGVYFEHSRGGLRFLDRIESVNPKLNAIVTVADGALEAAVDHDVALGRRDQVTCQILGTDVVDVANDAVGGIRIKPGDLADR